jgi:hypothetical protein
LVERGGADFAGVRVDQSDGEQLALGAVLFLEGAHVGLGLNARLDGPVRRVRVQGGDGHRAHGVNRRWRLICGQRRPSSKHRRLRLKEERG